MLSSLATSPFAVSKKPVRRLVAALSVNCGPRLLRTPGDDHR
jgi:hypothetical protein